MKNRATLFAAAFASVLSFPGSSPGQPAVTASYTLPRISLSQFGNPACTPEALEQAKQNGLKFTDLPSIGSGLAKCGNNEFYGITDRGPNGKSGADDEGASHRIFPLPQFCPAIVRFKLTDHEIRITQFIPLRDTAKKLITGLNNLPGEEPLYESPTAKIPIPMDQNGVDLEAIRLLPDGNFLLSEEYSPSILVVAADGRVLMRYTPTSKPLPNATYPVRAILPDIFTRRRVNKGFENLALSADGRYAYAILQSPMGDATQPEYADSRMIRALKLDVSHPLDAKMVGEYLLPASQPHDYIEKQKQSKISWSDADWVAPDELLVLERAKGTAKLLLVDLRKATNILGRKEEAGLTLESAGTDLAAHGIQAGSATEVFSTHDVPGITSDKIEGVSILDSTTVALANDNDFGIGENATGEPSMVWIVHLGKPLPLTR
jgi:hypothetical protein